MSSNNTECANALHARQNVKKYRIYIKPIYVDGTDHIDALFQAKKYCENFGELLEFSNVHEVKDE